MKGLDKPEVNKFDSHKYNNIINRLTETTPRREEEIMETGVEILTLSSFSQSLSRISFLH